ncbi:IS4 family transposase [Gloeomargarita lithophora Alchichica-D10]|uniref:IS4 family transposase n=1 Tax=Gloeomargarita lithophora Alchichica-D10 TaxID=1188229 RepID=A0A1J0A907_9CYAN|nr:IS4 family transposase [Gloeomargarita lithophora Alchichica-D10]
MVFRNLETTTLLYLAIAVDSLGFPFFTHCTPANVADDVGLVEMLTLNMDYFKAKPVTIPKITIRPGVPY